MLLRCRCLTKSPPCLVFVLFWCLAQNVWHPNNVPDLAPNSETLVPQNNLWGPFWGSIFGPQFWGLVFGSSFGTQFWIRSGTKKRQLSVPLFGTKSGSIFGVQNFGLAYIVNKGWIPGPSFGTKNGPSSGTKKIRKINQIWHQNVGPNLILQTQIQIWHLNKGPDLASKKGSISGTQVRDLIWL